MMPNEGFLRLTVEEDLVAFQTENAVFVAEKLVAAFPSAESKHLLARAYLQADDAQRAFCTLYPASTAKNRSVLAPLQGLFPFSRRKVPVFHQPPSFQVPAGRLREKTRQAEGGRNGTAERQFRN